MLGLSAESVPNSAVVTGLHWSACGALLHGDKIDLRQFWGILPKLADYPFKKVRMGELAKSTQDELRPHGDTRI